MDGNSKGEGTSKVDPFLKESVKLKWISRGIS